MMGSSAMIVFALLFVGVTYSLPMKNNEVEDLVFRTNDLGRLNPYSDNGITEILEKGRFRSRRLPMNPVLYDYYMNALDAAYGRRDDQSMDMSDRREMIKKNFDEIDRTGFKHLKRNFDEIDRVGFSELKRNV